MFFKLFFFSRIGFPILAPKIAFDLLSKRQDVYSFSKDDCHFLVCKLGSLYIEKSTSL